MGETVQVRVEHARRVIQIHSLIPGRVDPVATFVPELGEQLRPAVDEVLPVPVALISKALSFSFLVSSKFFKACTCIELGFISAKSKF